MTIELCTLFLYAVLDRYAIAALAKRDAKKLAPVLVNNCAENWNAVSKEGLRQMITALQDLPIDYSPELKPHEVFKTMSSHFLRDKGVLQHKVLTSHAACCVLDAARYVLHVAGEQATCRTEQGRASGGVGAVF